MSWYCAHNIIFMEHKDQPQARFPVWENMILLQAETADEAFEKAERLGHLEEGDDNGSLRWGGKPARRVFAGVRKVTECLPASDRPGDGTEVTYNELELDSREAVAKLACGETVHAYHADLFRSVSVEKSVTEAAACLEEHPRFSI